VSTIERIVASAGQHPRARCRDDTQRQLRRAAGRVRRDADL